MSRKTCADIVVNEKFEHIVKECYKLYSMPSDQIIAISINRRCFTAIVQSFCADYISEDMVMATLYDLRKDSSKGLPTTDQFVFTESDLLE